MFAAEGCRLGCGIRRIDFSRIWNKCSTAGGIAPPLGPASPPCPEETAPKRPPVFATDCPPIGLVPAEMLPCLRTIFMRGWRCPLVSPVALDSLFPLHLWQNGRG